MYATGTNFRGVNTLGGVSVSRIVIAVRACWLIKRGLARVPPPSILYGGMIITVPPLVLTLGDLRVALAGCFSGRVNAIDAISCVMWDESGSRRWRPEQLVKVVQWSYAHHWNRLLYSVLLVNNRLACRILELVSMFAF